MGKFTFETNGEAGSAGTDAGKSGTSSGDTATPGTSDGIANEAGNGGSEGLGSFGAAPAPKRRRGRKPYPRDPVTGEPIRPATGTASGTGSTTDKGGEERLAVKNDREKVRANIMGLHAMASVLTKQPVLILNDKEGDLLTTAVCDVADYHGINLISAGGAFGLYAALATTGYMIYTPRIRAIKFKEASDKARRANPTDESEARTRQNTRSDFRMDFSNDILH